MTDRRGGWRSVRARLLIIVLLPVLVLTPALIAITMTRWLMRTDQILATRVASDLTVAQQYLGHLIENTARQVEAFAASTRFRDDGPAALPQARGEMGLDFLLLRAAAPGSNGLAVLSSRDLATILPGLADRANIPLVETAGSAPTTRHTEDRGMVVLASTPVTLPSGERSVLVGGILLNRNDAFIDRISDLVYPATDPGLTDRLEPDLSHGLDLGIITLFLDDTRISTTLRSEDGRSKDRRAIGTRVSEEVSTRVLGEGHPWNDTAFVVSAWYISAYAPVTDSAGNRIGMIYAGIPKAPYTKARLITLAMIGAAFLAVVALFVPLALHWARGIFRPVEAMGRTIARAEAGDLAARSGAQTGAEEITRLSAHLDQLLTQLAQRDRELRSLNEDLNARVDARTADLTQANQALEATSRQLVLAERLATIGEVTAGVAHEINNPLAVMSGNLEVVRMVLAEREAEAATELDLIEDQIARINALVNQMLHFARPDEFGGSDIPTDPAQAIAGLRPLVRHLLVSGDIRLTEDLRATRSIPISAHALQQVLINLFSNAVQAMPEDGSIRLSSHDETREGRLGVQIAIEDSGRGMAAQTLAQAFTPFFTQRGAGGGTGLGLPICQNLVARAGGELVLESQPGHGTRAILWLPEAKAEA